MIRGLGWSIFFKLDFWPVCKGGNEISNFKNSNFLEENPTQLFTFRSENWFGNTSIQIKWIVKQSCFEYFVQLPIEIASLFNDFEFVWILKRKKRKFLIFNKGKKSYVNLGLQTLLNAFRILLQTLQYINVNDV